MQNKIKTIILISAVSIAMGFLGGVISAIVIAFYDWMLM